MVLSASPRSHLDHQGRVHGRDQAQAVVKTFATVWVVGNPDREGSLPFGDRAALSLGYFLPEHVKMDLPQLRANRGTDSLQVSQHQVASHADQRQPVSRVPGTLTISHRERSERVSEKSWVP
jgi:hypothetical protein